MKTLIERLRSGSTRNGVRIRSFAGIFRTGNLFLAKAVQAEGNLLFPPECVRCGTPQAPLSPRERLCADCIESMRLAEGPSCTKCAAPVPPGMSAADITECPWCRGVRFGFQSVVALGVYQGVMMETVLAMKQQFYVPLTLAMGQLLAKRVMQTHTAGDIDLVAPIPMHWRRRLFRNVNCPDILCEPVAKSLSVKTTFDLLYFRRAIRQQRTLDPKARRRNVKGALAVSPGRSLSGARILVVDDILTTGSTAHEAAKVLRKAGAAAVEVAVAARGIGA